MVARRADVFWEFGAWKSERVIAVDGGGPGRIGMLLHNDRWLVTAFRPCIAVEEWWRNR